MIQVLKFETYLTFQSPPSRFFPKKDIFLLLLEKHTLIKVFISPNKKKKKTKTKQKKKKNAFLILQKMKFSSLFLKSNSSYISQNGTFQPKVQNIQTRALSA